MMTSNSIPTRFSIEPATWLHDRAALLAVRETVFVAEQGVPADEEVDALDPDAWHVLARDLRGEPIGAGRLTSQPRIGRMAVLPAWRGKGVGRAILQSLIDQARSRGYADVSLHAQVQVRDFYAAAGFTPAGEPFDECGIPHQRMHLALQPLAGRADPPPRVHGVARTIQADGPTQLLEATLELLEGARHRIALFSPALDGHLLSNDLCLKHLRRIASSGAQAQLRFIVQDVDRAVSEAGALITLAQKLPSTMHMRVAGESMDVLHSAAFLLNDAQGYLHRPQSSRPAAHGSTRAPGRHAQLLRLFDEIWERSHDSPKLRALAL